MKQTLLQKNSEVSTLDLIKCYKNIYNKKSVDLSEAKNRELYIRKFKQYFKRVS